MINVYARTFMIATRLDAIEADPMPRRSGPGRVTRLVRSLGWWR